jgi:hypothetical protein
MNLQAPSRPLLSATRTVILGMLGRSAIVKARYGAVGLEPAKRGGIPIDAMPDDATARA